MPEKAENNETERILDLPTSNIKDLIITIRGVQVLLDSDVAMLYGYETKTINQAANRNKKRFPPEFRFQITMDETEEILMSQSATSSDGTYNRPQNRESNENESLISLRSQIVTLKPGRGEHRKYLSYVYTEQGIGMLSGILKNETAVNVSIGIMNAFVEMRRLINSNRNVYEHIANINSKLLQHDGKISTQSAKIDEIIGLLNEPDTNKQWIFYKGQFYDAFKLVVDLISIANKNVIIIDNYADNSVLDMLANKKAVVTVTIITANPGKLSQQHIGKFTAQHGPVKIVSSNDFHDRFIILDEKEVYAFGASIKDLGKKCFEVSKSEDPARFISYLQGII